MSAGELVRVYDLREAGAWRAARLHRSMWGRLYTVVYILDADHIALIFRSGGERWKAWERVRMQWIMEKVA